MKLKGKRTTFQSSYDSELGCFTDSYMLQCKGGGGTQTTTTGPSPEQRAILNKQLGYADKMEGLGPMEFFEGDTTAGMSSDTEAGLAAQLEAAGDTGALSDTAMARFQDAMAYDPMNDPNTEKFLDAVTNPLISKYETQIAPKLSSAAVRGGAFGGDRAAIQQERAISNLTGQVTDARSKALQGMVDSNRKQQLGMLQQLPSMQNSALLSSRVLQDVGAAKEGYTQTDIDADRERFEFEQNAPRQNIRDASAMLSGLDFGSITTSKGGGK